MSDHFDNVLFGLTADHLCQPGAQGYQGLLHQQVLSPFLRLREAAAEAGFDLRIVSGFRSFERQAAIWNGKLSGQRPVYDREDRRLDLTVMPLWQQLQAVMIWSAIPGTSRHHWGTDIDVYDAAAVAADYRVSLTADEVVDDGVFGPLHCWLDQRIAAGQSFGFFRPYALDLGGVAPERWHLSYAPLSYALQQAMTVGRVRDLWQRSDLIGKALLLEHAETLLQRYVMLPDEIYPPWLEVRA